MTFTRKQILERLNAQIKAGKPIIGAGVGIGISAVCAEKGGADLLIVYNSGRFRMAGRPSVAGLFAFSDANSVVMDMAAEILPVVKDTPVLAGVLGSDPFRNMDEFLPELMKKGYSGIQNFPSYGGFKEMAEELEQSGLGYSKEIALVKKAHEMDIFTSPYCYTVKDAIEMAEAGADVLVPHMGGTAKGYVGVEKTRTYEQCIDLIQPMADAAKEVNPDIIVLCHGGPLSEPQDVQYVLSRLRNVTGFYGASAMERIPVERAITETVGRFKSLKI